MYQGTTISSSTDLTGTNNSQYLTRPGIAWKSLGGTMGIKGMGTGDVNSLKSGQSVKFGFNGDSYAAGINSAMPKKDTNDLSIIRDIALNSQHQTAGTAAFSWICIDLTNVPNDDYFKIGSMTIGSVSRIEEISIEQNSRSVLDLSGLRFGQKNYFDIADIGVNSFGVDAKIYLATERDVSKWQPWSIYAITSMASPEDVAELNRLKEIAEQAASDLNEANNALARAKTKIEQFNENAVLFSETLFDSYEEEFLAFQELAAEYEETQAILASAESLFAAVTAAKEKAEADYDAYKKYGEDRQSGFDDIFSTDTWDIKTFDWAYDQVYLMELGQAPTQDGAAAPEPASVLIFGLGLAGLGLIRRKK
jgi:hypothetical protein